MRWDEETDLPVGPRLTNGPLTVCTTPDPRILSSHEPSTRLVVRVGLMRAPAHSPGVRRRLAILVAALTLPFAQPASGSDAFATLGEALGQERPLHPSILIQGDEGFLQPGSGVRSGSGTAEDPYVIARWSIRPTGHSFALRLIGTRAHVVIEDVVAVDTDASLYVGPLDACDPCYSFGAIEIRSAENVTVRDLSVPETGTGLVVDRSPGIRVDRVGIGVAPARRELWQEYGADYYGMVVTHSPRAILSNVTILDAPRGFHVAASADLTLRDSHVARTGMPGSPLWAYRSAFFSSPGLQLIGNRFEDVNVNLMPDTRDAVVLGNSFTRGALALEGEDGAVEGVYVCGNRFEAASVSLFLAERVLVAGNRFTGNANWTGVFERQSSEIRIERNLFERNKFGLYAAFYPGDGLVARNNSFVGHSSAGAFVERADVRGNWWGDPSGPGGDGPGAGDKVDVTSAAAQFEPWLTSPPDLDVDCATDFEPPRSQPDPPLEWTERVVDFAGSVAARVRTAQPVGASWDVTVLLGTRMRDMTWSVVVVNDDNGLASTFYGDAFSKGFVDAQVPLAGVDVTLEPEELGDSEIGVRVRCDPTMISCVRNFTIVVGSGAGTTWSRVTMRSTADPQAMSLETTERTGFIELRTMEQQGAYVATGPVNLAYVQYARASFDVEGTLVGSVLWLHNSVGSGRLTLIGPDGRYAIDPEWPSLPLNGEPAGTYHVEYRSGANPIRERPRVLWADFPVAT